MKYNWILRFFPPKKWKQFKQDWIAKVKQRYGKDIEFFPYNPKWVFELPIQSSPIVNLVKLTTSDGKERPSRCSGFFIFKGFSLHLYDGCFLPFLDKSPDTYPGGRYLDLKKRKGDTYVIDFNYAYTPLCAYSTKYSCPTVPQHNTISVDVKAGMKRP